MNEMHDNLINILILVMKLKNYKLLRHIFLIYLQLRFC